MQWQTTTKSFNCRQIKDLRAQTALNVAIGPAKRVQRPLYGAFFVKEFARAAPLDVPFPRERQ